MAVADVAQVGKHVLLHLGGLNVVALKNKVKVLSISFDLESNRSGQFYFRLFVNTAGVKQSFVGGVNARLSVA